MGHQNPRMPVAKSLQAFSISSTLSLWRKSKTTRTDQPDRQRNGWTQACVHACLQKEQAQKRTVSSETILPSIGLAGMAGLEPANARVKVWCLTSLATSHRRASLQKSPSTFEAGSRNKSQLPTPNDRIREMG